MNSFMPENTTCLITGASSGIGRELAFECAAHGHDVVLVARRRAELRRVGDLVRKQSHVRAEIIPMDLSTPGSADQLVAAIEDIHLHIDILINNAGFAIHGPFADSDPDVQTEMLQLKVLTLTRLTRRLLPPMIQRHHGHVLNIASIASYMPGPMTATYFASKAYVLSFSRAISAELRVTGVPCRALVAGPTRTHFASIAGLQSSRAFRGRVMEASEVAEAGYRAMMNGRSVATAGMLNKLRMLPVRVVPQRMLAYFAWKYHEPMASSASSS
jgi:short-subunit dehydrogenase